MIFCSKNILKCFMNKAHVCLYHEALRVLIAKSYFVFIKKVNVCLIEVLMLKMLSSIIFIEKRRRRYFQTSTSNFL